MDTTRTIRCRRVSRQGDLVSEDTADSPLVDMSSAQWRTADLPADPPSPLRTGGMVKRDEEIMEILEAYDLTGSYRKAAELAGCDHHTVRRYVQLRGQGSRPD